MFLIYFWHSRHRGVATHWFMTAVMVKTGFFPNWHYVLRLT